MSSLALEERITLLETEVLHLKRQLNQTASSPWWEHIQGMFAETPAFDEAVRLGRQYRKAQRPKRERQQDTSEGTDVSA
jgi:hypothetical protein